MVRSGMRIAAAVVAVVVVSGCGGDGSSAPKSPSPWGKTTMVAPSTTSPSPSLSPSSSASPQPSETFSPEQQEAADRVIEYFRILDEVSTNPEASIQPLADITTGQTQVLDTRQVGEYRSKGWVQTGVIKVHIKGAAEATEVDDSQMVEIQACTDSREVEIIDSKTSEKVLNPVRPRTVAWQIQVVKPATVWLIGAIIEAYSWGLLTRVRRRKGRLALLR